MLLPLYSLLGAPSIGVAVVVTESGDDILSTSLQVVPHAIAVLFAAVELGDDTFAATLIQLGTLSPGTRIIKRGHYDRTINRAPENLLPLEQGETDVLTFDYTDSLETGETLVSGTVTLSVVQGEDPSPNSMRVGSAQASTPYILQKVGGGVRNTTYLCYCAATTSTGRVLVNAGILPVIAFGQP